jgi:hypothetical protein
MPLRAKARFRFAVKMYWLKRAEKVGISGEAEGKQPPGLKP